MDLAALRSGWIMGSWEHSPAMLPAPPCDFAARPLCCPSLRAARGRSIISNATRWTTFQKLLPAAELPETEKLFLERYRPSPSFLSIHMGEAPAPASACHWRRLLVPSPLP